MLEADRPGRRPRRTEVRDGYRFDLGGHRFFTKSPEVEALWLELLGPELLLRRRLSRIYWRGRADRLPAARRRRGPQGRRRRGRPQRRLLCGRAACGRARRAETFEQWVTQRFGRRLFELFFRSYTEKVWGVPTSEIRAEWAAQRIRGLSLWRAAASALGAGGGGRPQPDRGVPLPAPRPRADVGADGGRRSSPRGGEVVLDAPVSAIRFGAGGGSRSSADGERLTAADA